ncbi:ABC transporter ATP-binding protein [Lacibacterium aquatile]|uniref:ABC transporter ATP-binding protein n=1 Tax=Lacibacterium aquatile TaxID=1168082 RepID=A0ABW5DSH6_9PROT
MSALIEIRDLDVTFGSVRAVEGVSFNVRAGTTLGLVGESGSGKTTISKVVLGLQEPSAGSVLYDGRDVQKLQRADKGWFRRQTQMIFQDPASSLSPRMTIRKALEEPLKIHDLPLKQHWPRVEELMRAIGLRPDHLEKYPHQLSGGQARRVGIARALILEPKLVVADEPTAGLDVSIQGDLLNLMDELQTRLSLTYLMVSHNLNVVRTVTDDVAVLYLGRLVETGSTKSIFAAPAHPYTRALLAANPEIDPHRTRKHEVLEGDVPSPYNRPSGCQFRTRCPMVQERCKTDNPALAALSDGRTVACHFPLA